MTKIRYNNFVEFWEWISKKYVEWRGERFGNHASVAEFAKLFGASQPLMSEWMKRNGKVPESRKYINALAAVYGLEVYGVLGLELPGFDDRVRLAVQAAVDEMARLGVTDSESPEAKEIVAATVARYGLKATTQD